MPAPLELRWVEIDLSAIARNTRWALRRLEGAALCAVVKADGYGHGAVEVSKTVLKAGASRLGVRDVSEAAALRAAGIKAPILLLAPILPSQAREAARLNVSVTIDDLAQARALNAAAGSKRVAVHVDVDSGLGRWGVSPRGLGELMAALARLPRLRVEGLSTHIDYVPGKNAVEAEEKLGAFERLAAPYKKKDPSLIVRAANSSVLLDFPHRRFDMACVGNLLYGITRTAKRPAAIAAPWRFRARILRLREVRKGQSIGYASEYVAPKAMRVATIAAGYADGITMVPAERLIGFGAGHEYWAMLGEAKLPFVGRCGIAHVLVDASSAPRAKAGDVVTLPSRRTAARAPRVYL